MRNGGNDGGAVTLSDKTRIPIIWGWALLCSLVAIMTPVIFWAARTQATQALQKEEMGEVKISILSIQRDIREIKESQIRQEERLRRAYRFGKSVDD